MTKRVERKPCFLPTALSVVELRAFGMNLMQAVPTPFTHLSGSRTFRRPPRRQHLPPALDHAPLALEVVVIHMYPNLRMACEKLNVSRREIWVRGLFVTQSASRRGGITSYRRERKGWVTSFYGPTTHCCEAERQLVGGWLHGSVSILRKKGNGKRVW